jgi:hypothetical protein
MHPRPHLTSPRLRVASVVVVFLLCFAAAHASVRWATLEAIHQLENPHNLTRPGPCGELGPYQFRSSTWQMHTHVAFSLALDRKAADEVAVRHYEWLKRGLEAAHLPATPYNIALAWNGGLSAVIAGTSPRVAHEYASRVANLAGEFDASTRLVADAR